MKRIFWIFLSTIMLCTSLGLAQKKGVKISGYMFGDFYWVAANHHSDLVDRTGFWFRRIYLTFDYGISDDFSTRLRFEMSSPGDFTTSAKMSPSVKDAYLKWKISSHAIVFGLSGTPTWGIIEKLWGYRSVEKTPLDLQKGFGSSRDLGIALKGTFDEDKSVYYHFMLGNGHGTKSEVNKQKKIFLSLGYNRKPLVVEGYADWGDSPGENNSIYTLQGFAAYKTDLWRAGIQFAQQTRQMGTGSADLNLKIASIFAAYKISEKVSIFGRFDHMFEPNPKGESISYIPFSDTAKSNFIVGGVDITPVKNVHIIPNVEAVLYSGGGDPDADIIPRLTVFYEIK